MLKTNIAETADNQKLDHCQVRLRAIKTNDKERGSCTEEMARKGKQNGRTGSAQWIQQKKSVPGEVIHPNDNR